MAEDKLSQHPRQWAEPWWRALSCGASRRVLILLEIQRILLRESAQTCTLAHMQDLEEICEPVLPGCKRSPVPDLQQLLAILTHSLTLVAQDRTLLAGVT